MSFLDDLFSEDNSNALTFAAALLQPTRTGSFGEALSRASLLTIQNAKEKENAEINRLYKKALAGQLEDRELKRESDEKVQQTILDNLNAINSDELGLNDSQKKLLAANIAFGQKIPNSLFKPKAGPKHGIIKFKSGGVEHTRSTIDGQMIDPETGAPVDFVDFSSPQFKPDKPDKPESERPEKTVDLLREYKQFQMDFGNFDKGRKKYFLDPKGKVPLPTFSKFRTDFVEGYREGNLSREDLIPPGDPRRDFLLGRESKQKEIEGRLDQADIALSKIKDESERPKATQQQGQDIPSGTFIGQTATDPTTGKKWTWNGNKWVL